LLQIIEKPDGSIIGHYEESDFSNKGKESSLDASVSGAVNNDIIIVKLKSEAMFGELTLSGSVVGDTLRISGEKGVNIEVKRGSESFYTQWLQGLRRDAEFKKEREETKKITKWMKNYSSEVTKNLAGLSKAQEKFTELTKKIQSRIERITSEPKNSEVRSQNEAEISTLRAYFNMDKADMERSEVSFGYSSGAINIPDAEKKISIAQSYCRFIRQGSDDVCDAFRLSFAEYQNSAKQLAVMFSNSEAAWQAESDKQCGIWPSDTAKPYPCK
jgi:hypothetical protein